MLGFCSMRSPRVLSLMLYSAACLSVMVFAFSCRSGERIQKLHVEERNKFDALGFVKIFQIDLYGRWCLACPHGIVCSENLDRNNREYKFSLYNYSGALIRDRRILAGQGPTDIQGGNLNTVWLSSSRKIFCLDVGGYLKTIDPETLEVETIAKLSNVIDGYGSRYTMGRISGSHLEEKNGRIVTTFESSGFPEDFTYFLVSCINTFQNYSVIATERKEKPPSSKKLEESRRKGGPLENFVDYYGRLRLERTFSVDWKRDMVYLIPDIERPEVERIDLKNKKKVKYQIDVNIENFLVEREEFDLYNEYVAGETPEILKKNIKSTLYVPTHAPALMGTMVIGDRLLVITGNRNWKKGENETLVFQLPSLEYEGSFFIPFSNYQNTKSYDPYYINVNRIKKDEDYSWRYEIYRLVERSL
jgi:hypothetical protein